jgi:hypothetical protein
MRNRRLLGLMVQAAGSTIRKSLCDGKPARSLCPGIVSLIQTHGDSLDWNSHLAASTPIRTPAYNTSPAGYRLLILR